MLLWLRLRRWWAVFLCTIMLLLPLLLLPELAAGNPVPGGLEENERCSHTNKQTQKEEEDEEHSSRSRRAS